MKLDKALALIKESEGCSLTAYQKEYNGKKDKVTIGWGNTEFEDGRAVNLSDKITQERADALLLHFVKKTAERVHDLCFPVEFNENEFNAVVSFVYNIGIGAFKRSTMLAMVHNSKYSSSDIAAEFLRWTKINGKESKGLKNRREKERALFLSEEA